MEQHPGGETHRLCPNRRKTKHKLTGLLLDNMANHELPAKQSINHKLAIHWVACLGHPAPLAAGNTKHSNRRIRPGKMRGSSSKIDDSKCLDLKEYGGASKKQKHDRSVSLELRCVIHGGNPEETARSKVRENIGNKSRENLIPPLKGYGPQ